MKKHIIFLLLFLIFTALKCKKGPDILEPSAQLPPITDSGANTFGCKVNGNVWLPYYNGWSTQVNALAIAEEKSSNNYRNFLIVASNRKNEASDDLEIDLNNVNDTGYYRIYNSLNTGLVFSSGNYQYEPFDTFATVHVSHLDTVKKIISGTFSSIAYSDTNRVTRKIVYITDGRFDMHYPTVIHFITR